MRWIENNLVGIFAGVLVSAAIAGALWVLDLFKFFTIDTAALRVGEFENFWTIVSSLSGFFGALVALAAAYVAVKPVYRQLEIMKFDKEMRERADIATITKELTDFYNDLDPLLFDNKYGQDRMIPGIKESSLAQLESAGNASKYLFVKIYFYSAYVANIINEIPNRASEAKLEYLQAIVSANDTLEDDPSAKTFYDHISRASHVFLDRINEIRKTVGRAIEEIEDLTKSSHHSPLNKSLKSLPEDELTDATGRP
nr:hypothetical protein [uncultured Cohaesibacter sp.]